MSLQECTATWHLTFWKQILCSLTIKGINFKVPSVAPENVCINDIPYLSLPSCFYTLIPMFVHSMFSSCLNYESFIQ